MTKSQIREIALANGFKLKKQPDGSEDLNPYVYEFADKLINQYIKDSYVHVGYTNGANIKLMQGTDYGAMYSNTNQNCYIPLYMLEGHLHRIETTGGDSDTAIKLQEAE